MFEQHQYALRPHLSHVVYKSTDHPIVFLIVALPINIVIGMLSCRKLRLLPTLMQQPSVEQIA